MNASFTDWQGVLRSYAEMPDELEHHGIKGMAWGVRRYQNEDGSLTPLGREHYGYSSTKRISAKKMAKDFNALDRGYANVEADRQRYARKTAKLARKGHRAERKGRKEKAEKLLKRALKNGQKAALSNKQKKAIEQLQWKIIGKAAMNGYTTTSEPILRYGRNRVNRATKNFFGGKYAQVNGQTVTMRRRGEGGTNIVNYANANKLAEEARKIKRTQQMAGIRR